MEGRPRRVGPDGGGKPTAGEDVEGGWIRDPRTIITIIHVGVLQMLSSPPGKNEETRKEGWVGGW